MLSKNFIILTNNLCLDKGYTATIQFWVTAKLDQETK